MGVNASGILMPRRWGKVTLPPVNVAFDGYSEGRSLRTLSNGCRQQGMSCFPVPVSGTSSAVGFFQ